MEGPGQGGRGRKAEGSEDVLLSRSRPQMLGSGPREGSLGICKQERWYPTAWQGPGLIPPAIDGELAGAPLNLTPCGPGPEPQGDPSGQCTPGNASSRGQGQHVCGQLASFRHLFPLPPGTFPGPPPSVPPTPAPASRKSMWQTNTSRALGGRVPSEDLSSAAANPLTSQSLQSHIPNVGALTQSPPCPPQPGPSIAPHPGWFHSPWAS